MEHDDTAVRLRSVLIDAAKLTDVMNEHVLSEFRDNTERLEEIRMMGEALRCAHRWISAPNVAGLRLSEDETHLPKEIGSECWPQ